VKYRTFILLLIVGCAFVIAGAVSWIVLKNPSMARVFAGAAALCFIPDWYFLNRLTVNDHDSR